jgi:hypothetical protein
VFTDARIDGTSIVQQTYCSLTDVGAALFNKPPARDSSIDRADEDGIWELTTYYQARVAPLTGRIPLQPSWGNFLASQALVSSLFETGIDHELECDFVDGSTRLLTFRTIGEWEFAQTGHAPSGVWSVQVRAADPRWYSGGLISSTFDPVGVAPGGFTVPFVLPFDPQGAGLNVFSIANAGNTRTFPTYTFTGPWNNPWLMNQTTGVAMYFQGVTLGAGQTLIINTAARKVTYNGSLVQDIVDWSRSDWPMLLKGQNVFTAGGDYFAGSTLQALARSAWI